MRSNKVQTTVLKPSKPLEIPEETDFPEPEETDFPDPVEINIPDPMDDAYDPYKLYSGSDEELSMLGLYSPDNEQFNN